MSFAILPAKPQAPVSYKLIESQNIHPDSSLIVFINSIGLPSVLWTPTIALLQRSTSSVKPSILKYDRYDQAATTSQDSADNIPEKGHRYGHDLHHAVSDLNELIMVTVPRNSKLVLVAASICVHIARLYAQKHAATVEGLLFLDPNIGNAEATDLWPNSHTPDFKESNVLGDDFVLEQHIEAVMVMVIGHEPEPFAEEMWKILKITKSIDRKYTQFAWQQYNEALFNLNDADRSTNKVLVAPGCGHFIQKDNPQFVSTQLEDPISRIQI
ncbi:hypothetical protein BELL_0206g00060 [Botrytis elliptica]|uniref:AB hydrolase-1 domain-containing protein n=1 Tax=Botrytis elliptica TaxID=278938 RepID=A0A4Z1JV85_9HELO|nr:hypothetical protein EAE99_003792 [Botrytis elliptica]TGO75560.1 hypothetical protein BELL_0206g00060 [Botrytis elliptica]